MVRKAPAFRMLEGQRTHQIFEVSFSGVLDGQHSSSRCKESLSDATSDKRWSMNLSLLRSPRKRRRRSMTSSVRSAATTSAVDFGQFRLRPAFFFRVRPISTSANFWMLNFGTTKCGAPKGGPKKKWGPEGWGAQKGGAQKGWSLEGWGAQNFALFFPSSRHNFLSSFSLLGSFRGILVVFEAPGP